MELLWECRWGWGWDGFLFCRIDFSGVCLRRIVGDIGKAFVTVGDFLWP